MNTHVRGQNLTYSIANPNSSAPAGSDMPLERTKVTEKTYEGFVRLDFASSIGNFPRSYLFDVGVSF